MPSERLTDERLREYAADLDDPDWNDDPAIVERAQMARELLALRAALSPVAPVGESPSCGGSGLKVYQDLSAVRGEKDYDPCPGCEDCTQGGDDA